MRTAVRKKEGRNDFKSRESIRVVREGGMLCLYNPPVSKELTVGERRGEKPDIVGGA